MKDLRYKERNIDPLLNARKFFPGLGRQPGAAGQGGQGLIL
jgi:hypothetical protein